MKDSRSRGKTLGPYRLGRKCRGSGGMGRVFRAFNVHTGAPALVLRPMQDQLDAQPLADWQVRACSSVSPPYLALEVEHAPQAPSLDAAEELVWMLDDLSHVAERLVGKPEVLAHLQGPPRRQPVRRVWVWSALAASVAVLLALGALWLPVAERPESGGVELAGASQEGAWSEEATTGVHTAMADEGPILLARPLPKKPFYGQKRPPCDKVIETEISGGCWLETTKQAPCPDKLYESQGKCYVPVFDPPKAPTAITW